MRCATVQSRLSAARDGELRGDLAREVESHCATCAACATVRDQIRASDIIARECLPPEEPVSPTFVGDLERRIAREGHLPAPEPTGGVRALVPLAAAVLLGAGLTFAGMRVFGGGSPGGVQTGGPSEYASFEASRDQFAAASDVILTGLQDLSLADPAQELALARREVLAAGVRPAIQQVAQRMPTAAQRDPRLATRLSEAVEGMEVVLASLEAEGAPEDALLRARQEIVRRQLIQNVRALAPEGLPRPTPGGLTVRVYLPATPGMSGDTQQFLLGVRAYAQGELEQARAAFEAAAQQTERRDHRARAAYWATRCYTLENRPADAAKHLRMVADWSPEAASGLCRFLLRGPGGEVFVFASNTEGGSHVVVEQHGAHNRTVVKQGGPSIGPRGGPEPAGADPADEVRRALLKFGMDARDMRRQFQAAMREVSRAERMLMPALGQLTDILEVRADGEVVTPADADLLRKVLPVLLSKFADYSRLQFAPQEDGDRLTLKLDTRNCRFASWDARRFVAAIGGAAAVKLRGAPNADPALRDASTLASVEIDVRLPADLRRVQAALRMLAEDGAPGTPK